MEEDTRLFREEPTLFNFEESDDHVGADDATRELLEEIDRSLNGFRQAARSHTWLGDAGLNADAHLLHEASVAQTAGTRAEQVDLARFVCDAIVLDGGQVMGQPQDPGGPSVCRRSGPTASTTCRATTRTSAWCA